MCHWPPYTSEKKIRMAIIEETSPDCIWITHKVLRIFGTSNTYESGIEKVKIAQDYSDLDISDVDISHQKRISRSKRMFRNNYSSSASEDSDQNNNTISENQQINKKKLFYHHRHCQNRLLPINQQTTK
ncbi:uncharacterized protein LOC115242560 [Formica exsecta]|uniref:uncharacterized protein LOC115242560 n=1 Tax=Formica exsecta TaxID=72781 RepID=UPI0011417C26|nr:uncharacterized protein LOC115242560 [Formica exsecta]